MPSNAYAPNAWKTSSLFLILFLWNEIRHWKFETHITVEDQREGAQAKHTLVSLLLIHTTFNTLFLNLPDLRGASSDRDTNDIFANCSLIFYYLDFKFFNFVCPSELYPLIWFFLKNSFRKKKIIRKTSQNALAPSIFIVWSIVLKLGTPLLHIQAENRLLQNF